MVGGIKGDEEGGAGGRRANKNLWILLGRY